MVLIDMMMDEAENIIPESRGIPWSNDCRSMFALDVVSEKKFKLGWKGGEKGLRRYPVMCLPRADEGF